MKNDLLNIGVLFHHCPVYPEYESPFTSITLSSSSGTRTGLHYRSETFPGNTVEDFHKLNLSDYKWVHFEVNPFWVFILAILPSF